MREREVVQLPLKPCGIKEEGRAREFRFIRQRSIIMIELPENKLVWTRGLKKSDCSVVPYKYNLRVVVSLAVSLFPVFVLS